MTNSWEDITVSLAILLKSRALLPRWRNSLRSFNLKFWIIKEKILFTRNFILRSMWLLWKGIDFRLKRENHWIWTWLLHLFPERGTIFRLWVRRWGTDRSLKEVLDSDRNLRVSATLLIHRLAMLMCWRVNFSTRWIWMTWRIDIVCC